MSAIYGQTPPRQLPQITDFLQPPVIGMRSNDTNRTPFHQALRDAMNGIQTQLRFSETAQQQMKAMGIELDAETLARLEDSLKKSKQSGAHQAIALVDRQAYVLDVQRREVVDLIHAGPNAERPKEAMNYRIQQWAVITQP